MIEQIQNKKLDITPVAPAKRSVEEERQDVVFQRQTFFNNAKTIMGADEAQKLMQDLTDDQIYATNSNFKDILTELKGRTNLTANFFRNFLQRYLTKQATTRTGGPGTETGILIPLNEENLQDLFQRLQNAFGNITGAQIGRIRRIMQQNIEDGNTDQNVVIQRLLERGLMENRVAIVQRIIQLEQALGGPGGGGGPDRTDEILEAIAQIQPFFDAVTDPTVDGAQVIQSIDRLGGFTGRAFTDLLTEIRRIQPGASTKEVDDIIKGAIAGIQLAGPGGNPGIGQPDADKIITIYTEDEIRGMTIQKLRQVWQDQKTGEEKPPAPPKTDFRLKDNWITALILYRSTQVASPKLPIDGTELVTEYSQLNTPQEKKDFLKKLNGDQLDAFTDKLPTKHRVKWQSLDGRISRQADIVVTGNQAEKKRYIRENTINEFVKPDSPQRAGLFAGISARRASVEPEEKEEKEEKGTGMMTYGYTKIIPPRARRIIGKGISTDESERYKEFGKYLLHIPSLKKGILNLKFPSFASIPTVKQTTLSRDLLDLIVDLMETNQVNKRLYTRMSKEDQDFFYTIAQKAGIDQTLGLGIRVNETHKNDMERFNLVRGQVIAGNNNPEVLRELKQYIVKFMRDGTMSKHQGNDLLFEISCLG